MTHDMPALMRAGAAGIVSAVLFAFAMKAGLGLIFFFAPIIPLLYVSVQLRNASAALAGTIACALLLNIGGAVVYAVMLGLPAYYIALHLHKNRNGAPFPMGLILTYLCVYACAFIVLLTCYYAFQDTPLHILISQQIDVIFSTIQEDLKLQGNLTLPDFAFVVVSSSIWIWVLMLYLCCWFTQSVLKVRKLHERDSVALSPFAMPDWVIQLLAITCLASFIGSPATQFAANTVLFSLILPYFLLGAALMHEKARSWPSRGILLFFIYFLIVIALWPVVILAGWGFWYQIKGLSALKS